MKRRKRCYISGKMSGLSYGQIDNNFTRASFEAFKLGYTPVSPFPNILPRQCPYWLHMAIDILLLLRCDAIYMQANWRDSRGAKIERWVAEKTGKILHEQLLN